MATTDIITRTTAGPAVTAKGSELTYTEEDNNFIILANFMASLNGGSGLAPYSSITAYTGIIYVEYNSKIYKHVGSGTDVGVTPGTDLMVWIEVSPADLLHAQNTDTYLAVGTADQVSAAAAADLINNQFVVVGLSAFNIAFNGGLLRPNRTYYISDTAFPLCVKTNLSGNISGKGLARLEVPNILNDHWDSLADGGSYAINVKVTWANRVYNNITGANTNTNPAADTTNWTIVAYGTPSSYSFKWFEIDLQYLSGSFDFFYNLLRDIQLNNTFRVRHAVLNSYLNIQAHLSNYCDSTSDLQINNFFGGFSFNKLANNSTVLLQKSNGSFVNNSLDNSIVDFDTNAPLDGIIQNLSIKDTRLTFPDGLDNVASNFNRVSISGFGKNSLVSGMFLRARLDADLTEIQITPEGSNAIDIINFAAALDLAVNGYPDLYGKFQSQTGTVTSILNYTGYFPVIIEPAGLSVSLTIVSAAAVTANNQLVSDHAAGVIALVGVNGDHAILKRRITIGAFDCILVEIKKIS